jgi:hypothetical protein
MSAYNPDYKAAVDRRVAEGKLELAGPGVYRIPRPAPVQTHIPAAPEDAPVMRGEAPPERQAVNPHKLAICKRLKLKYTPPIIHKARGCEGRRHLLQPPKAPKAPAPVPHDAQWERMQQAAAATGQADAAKFADSAQRLRKHLLKLKEDRPTLLRTDKKPLETRKAQQAASRAPAAWEARRL